MSPNNPSRMMADYMRHRMLPPPMRHGRCCKICVGDVKYFGRCSFASNANGTLYAQLAQSDLYVDYWQCRACGFLFSGFLDAWPAAAIKSLVYNKEYELIDPDSSGGRAARNGEWLMRHVKESGIIALDFGSGFGLLARHVPPGLFRTLDAYDPFHAAEIELRRGHYDMVVAFEVIEHAIDPVHTLSLICSLLAPGGVVLLSTWLQPADLAAVGMSWPYIAPRNGHVSIFSKAALAELAKKAGMRFRSLDHKKHLFYREEKDSDRYFPMDDGA